LKIVLKAATLDVPPVPAVSINYGQFINVVIDFLIVAFCIFMVVRGINSLKKKQ
jgi:large conductance mechanosensitive channel